MARFDARASLPDDQPGPWGEPVGIRYDQRDVMLYAVGIGIEDLRYVYEGHPKFGVFPTFPIRWGGAGAPVDRRHVPASPGPMNLDAERYLEVLAPLPVSGWASVRARLVAVHPRGKGNAFVETESEVTDERGQVCVRMVNGSFRRGVERLGDIEPFEGAGRSFSTKVDPPSRAPDRELAAVIARNQAHVYRLSGDYNPLHIDPAAARTGGFDTPILHGLCTYGHCGQMLLGALAGGDAERFRKLKVRFSSPVYPGDTLRIRAWNDGPGRVVFEGCVGEKVVVSNAFFEYQ